MRRAGGLSATRPHPSSSIRSLFGRVGIGNTTYSAVRLPYPDHTVVSGPDEKARSRTREKGMRCLRSRFTRGDAEEQDALCKRKAMVVSGDRSEKRTYTFRKIALTDPRIGLTRSSTAGIMDGKLQPP